MPEDYTYGFEFSEKDGREIIRYRRDKLWLKAGFSWYVFFQLIAWSARDGAVAVEERPAIELF